MNWNLSIKNLKGIGDKTAKLFNKLGVYTIGDMLLYFPRDYKCYPKAVSLAECVEEFKSTNKKEASVAIRIRIVSPPVIKSTAKMPIVVLNVPYNGGRLEAIWFRTTYIRSILKPSFTYVLYGKATFKNNNIHISQPEIYKDKEYISISSKPVPIYSLTKSLSQKTLAKAVRSALSVADFANDYMPPDILKRNNLYDYQRAISGMHFPQNEEDAKKSLERLAFDEFFLFCLGTARINENSFKESNSYIIKWGSYADKIINNLPFELTDDQKKVIDEIFFDLSSEHVMQRLLEGDVSSGKTMVALLAMVSASQEGYQSVIMAPTEVLARQHYRTFSSIISENNLDIPLVCLTGSMKKKEKEEAYKIIAEKENAIIIGTHALIQEGVNYNNLALVITDEQHRFGVNQRKTLSDKASSAHVLVMSATPIPRTLAIMLYSGMSISQIKHLPSKRLPIKNALVGEQYLNKAYDFIKKRIKNGEQAYLICPMVEENDQNNLPSVTSMKTELDKYYNNEIKTAILHGKMKSDEKNKIMAAFEKNEISLLISTTVVEVGVNVPNATVMMVLSADRFGLAQLHQLRGRIGRGEEQGYCIFVNLSDSDEAAKRLEVLNTCNDGFEIAAYDLKLRGPGNFFGIRQSGDMGFKIADIYRDSKQLKMAKTEADRLLSEDRDLEGHTMLKEYFEKYYTDFIESANI